MVVVWTMAGFGVLFTFTLAAVRAKEQRKFMALRASLEEQ